MKQSSDDLEWCYDILGDVSRTFEIPIKKLEEPRRQYVCVMYLMCRIPDTVEDSPNIDLDKKEDLLELYRECINNPQRSDVQEFESQVNNSRPSNPLEPKHWELAQNTTRVFRVFNSFPQSQKSCMKQWIDELTSGMKDFVHEYDGSVRIKDIDELEEYCYYVAGTVGHMLAEVNTENPSEELHELAEQYGLLLQTVNVAKDVHGDYHEEDNIYIPENLLQQSGVNQEDLLDSENIEKTTEAIEKVIEYSRNQVESARNYLRRCAEEGNLNYMRSWAIPYLLAIATLRELEDNAEVSLTEGGVKITRSEVGEIIKQVESVNTKELEQLELRIERGEFK